MLSQIGGLAQGRTQLELRLSDLIGSTVSLRSEVQYGGSANI